MSRAPYILPHLRRGAKQGNTTVLDSIIHDGLRDPHTAEDIHYLTERYIRKLGVSREEQDNFATRSYSRAAHATFEKQFEAEIVPISLRGESAGVEGQVVDRDQGVEMYQSIEQLPVMETLFDDEEVLDGVGGGGKGGEGERKEKGGEEDEEGRERRSDIERPTLTKGNVSNFGDACAVVVLVSEDVLRRQDLKPIAKIVGYTDLETAPKDFPGASSKVVQRLLDSLKLKMEDVDLFEVHESSAATSIVNQRQLNVDSEKVNVFGGAIALGHPLGASGARIVVTLLNALRKKNKSRGIAAIGGGGGAASTILVEKMSSDEGWKS